MPSVFAELASPRGIALAAVAVAVVAAPADARVGRSAHGPITRAERASIGAAIAFVREDGEKREAYVVRADGTGEQPLDPGPWQSYPAAASHAGELALIRAADHAGGHEEALAVRRVDGEVQVLARGPMVRNPAFAPDGASLAFESDRASFRDLYRVPRSGGDVVRLTDDREGNYEPSFVDGGALVFTSSRDGEAEIYRMRADGTAPVRLTRSAGDDVAPRPSPDGRLVAFLSARDGVDHVFVMRADGSDVRPVRAATQDEEREHTWSPDGTRLAFVAKSKSGRPRVLVWDRGRDAAFAITDGTTIADMPAFSPDGRYVAYVNDDGRGPDVWVARSDGSGAVRVAAAAGRRWLPVWIPQPTANGARASLEE